MSPIGTRRLRRPLAWLLIAQQILAGAGISLPRTAAAAGSAERYPCEHCGCGCRSAERCWTQCSCFTYQEKVAWARQHGVAVPEYAVAAAQREAAALGKPGCPFARRPCQGARQAGGPSHDTRTRNHGDRGSDRDRSSRGVSWLSALRCHGLTQQWQAVTAIRPGDRNVEFCPELPPRGRVESQPFLRHLFSPTPPPTPPPNVA
jgi:hypothetical protein